MQKYYEDTVFEALKKELGVSNPHQVPALEKIVVTTHCGRATDRKQAVEDSVEEIAKITGQKPSVSYARKSVANFKVREGEAVGARVTLRGQTMWEFLDRFVHIVAPSIRDFRGISSKSFDGNGNYAVGIADQSIFPDVELDKIKREIGFDLIFVTSADNDDFGRALLSALGMPFRDNKKSDESAA